jgi:GT2 family glycosyltransferase
MVEYYTNPDDVHEWIICDNNSSDAEKLPTSISIPLRVWRAYENIGDLPRYNAVMPIIETDFAIFLSTDMRILSHDWVNEFMLPFEDHRVAIVGAAGPGAGMTPRHADPAVGGEWHWIPKLLVDRGIEFTDCAHVQTHCFAVRTAAFRDVGGFWADESNFLSKENLIAGEISFSVKLRAKGWKMSHRHPAMHHYGNQAASQHSLDEYDRSRGWEVNF